MVFIHGEQLLIIVQNSTIQFINLGYSKNMSTASHMDLRDRAALFSGLEGRVFDILVIGGGITGAGIARDAAMRGLSVALIEARDFASGTSSRSSKMVHGGLRYLPKGEIGLVKEAVSERKVLNAIAPHLARPAWFVLPSPNRLSTVKFKAALTVYEKLGNVAKPDKHKVWPQKKINEHEPIMRTDNLHSAIAYREYLTDDARLVLANIRSGFANSAVLANYVKAEQIKGGTISEVHCQSTLDDCEGECRIRARTVINAAGPWVDALRQTEDKQAVQRLTMSKGIHLVFDRHVLPVKHTVIINTLDKRAIFAVPRGKFTYLGTTDGFYQGTDYWPTIEKEDVEYLVQGAARALHAEGLSSQNVISAWAGIRPLIQEAGKSSNEISRKDEIWTGSEGMLSIAGGKLSAYRAMAERIVDKVITDNDLSANPCSTKDAPLPGGAVKASLTPGLANLDKSKSERLLHLYGTEATDIAEDGGDVAAEARRAVMVEGAARLEDYWVRRSGRAWFDQNSGLDNLTPAAKEMAALLGWSPEKIKSEIENCRQIDWQSKSAFTAKDE